MASVQRSTLGVRLWALFSGSLLFPLLLLADTHYVDINCATPVAPYTNWTTAATVIQDAIDVASAADTVLVADGTYAAGGRAVYGTLTNRVAVVIPITVKSVNGPAVTRILGQKPLGPGALRCAYVTNGAALVGITLTNGSTRLSGDYSKEMSGGGVWCETGGFVSNCVFAGNSAEYAGGGASGGMLNNCTFFENTAFFGGGVYNGTLNNCALYGNNAGCGGGAYDGTLNNCTLSGNSAIIYGGGVEYGTLNNCIIYYNKAPGGANWGGGSIRYCCTTPSLNSIGCIENEPVLASATHLSVSSPCIGKGSTNAVGRDIDGELWKSNPSMGCDEIYGGSITGELRVAIQAVYTNLAVGFSAPLIARIEGATSCSAWSFGDGMTLSNRPYASHAWGSTGVYSVVLTAWNDDAPAGVSATLQVRVCEQQIRYVAMSNAAAAMPFDSWSNAATRIQDAVDACTQIGGLVLVSNGVYNTGGRAVYGAMTNRVVLSQSVTLRSVNGPAVTEIRGLGPAWGSSMRCAYVADGAVLAGFTLTNGTARAEGDALREESGGAVWCEVGGVVSNCIISGSSAVYGGGAFQGTLTSCTFLNNYAVYGGGAFQCTLNDCTLLSNYAYEGGGGDWSTLNNCELVGNTAEYYGGGVCDGYLNNCVLGGNSAFSYGGGAYWSTLRNCTVAGNFANESGGGVFEGKLKNCIVYYNSSYSSVTNNWAGNSLWLDYCCTTPVAPGTNTITAEPLFSDPTIGNYRLSAQSPCIDAGINEQWVTAARDVEGNQRIFNGCVDIGAYEYTMTAYPRVWLQGACRSTGHAMTNVLQEVGLLASQSPYAADLTLVGDFSISTVDWMLVELLRTNDLKTVAANSVLMLTDGSLVSGSGAPGVRLEVSPGLYYLTARHRNHIVGVSSQPVAFTNTVVSYDFTTGPDKYFGGTNACVELAPGVWGLIGGDADGDGRITPVDREIVRRQRGMTGYLQGDLNLDGKVDGGDQ
jgi:hypothetical protein